MRRQDGRWYPHRELLPRDHDCTDCRDRLQTSVAALPGVGSAKVTMIRHPVGELALAEDFLADAKRPEVRRLARTIVEGNPAGSRQ
jgi:hypothetical protein